MMACELRKLTSSITAAWLDKWEKIERAMFCMLASCGGSSSFVMRLNGLVCC